MRELQEIEYKPEYTEINREGQLLEEQAHAEARQRTQKELALFKKRRPLSEAEAADSQARLQATLNRMQSLQDRVSEKLDTISNRCQNITLEFSKQERPNLYKAIKRLFNVKTESITFEMYQAALKIREEEMTRESQEAFNES